MNLKRWHVFNMIRSGGEAVHPSIAKMAAPPVSDDRYIMVHVYQVEKWSQENPRAQNIEKTRKTTGH
ncbi:hypothetical protein SAMN05444972_101150 [Marininema halotolerans]|uniref:Uncharacterized protein n=1 Tax=Marininema halotolerans TaxID=1155944 RepID=A0A1I6NUN1_9BACL|nr:hypothetical protein SAMN05444972_101150 [Marininema halotolerans]